MLGTVRNLASYPLYGNGGKVERNIPCAHIAWDNGQQEVRNLDDVTAEMLAVGMRVSGVPCLYELEPISALDA